jgi:cysteine-rich repeat protein
MPRHRLCTGACLRVLVCVGALALARAQNTSTAPNTRPVQCGDYAVNGNETCDDGNTQPGDGCSGVCTIEAGYMCEYSYRAPAAPAQPGVLFNWLINSTMVLTGTPETCTGASLCLQSALWRPENWVALYAAGTVLPPSGYYCGDMCKLFPTPQGYRMGNSCQLEGVNECIEGLAACAYNSECEDKLPHETATGLGYVCRCDPQFFTTDVNGLGCAQSGVEITAIVAGKSGYNPAESPAPDIAVLEGVRAAFIDLILAQNYTEGVTREALLEGVEQYGAELVSASGTGVFVGRALWALKVRIASAQANLALMSAGTLWRDLELLGAVFNSSVTAGVADHLLHTSSRCANDRVRECASSADCLDGATCLHNVPDVTVSVLSAGGSTDSVTVPSSGFDLVSVTYDVTQTAWTARVRYDNTVAATMDVLYVSHMPTPLTAEAQSTFRPDEFPCLPVGTGELQQRRQDNICCLPAVDALYTTTSSFGAYLADNATALGAALGAAGACATHGAAPPGATGTLLDTSRDFVAGPLARMTRSTATIDDSVTTHGYQDLLVFLAEEDMRAYGGISSTIDGGFRLEFFIGMAHLKGTSTTALSAAFSHTKVTAEITQTFVFTTTAATETTFLDDINVNLVQVRAGGAGSAYLKFARVQITLPAALQAPVNAADIVPVSSARATTGFSVDTADAPVYPCLSGDLAALQSTLAGLQWCAFADPLCAPVGPATIGAGNQVHFIFPLPTGFWSEEQLDSPGLLNKFLFLDFMLSAVDAAGKIVYDRVQTRTEITRLSVAAQCETEQITAGITDIMEIDLYLGLTPSDALFDDSLVQAVDITSSATPVNMVREQSSTASNVMTMLIKGAPETFAQAYASEYALEVEDMLTMHFIQPEKRATVQALIDAGQAFETYAPSGSESLMRLRPTQALLEICPIHATKNTFGCITRRDIQERMHDVVTQSVFKFSPHNATVRDDTFDAAGRWMQSLLGASDYVFNLGRSHAQVMTDRFQLDNRYRPAYLVKPTVPWRQTEMDQQGIASVLELAQSSISVVLVAFDQNVGETYAPTTQVSLQVQFPVPSTEFGTNAALQAELQAAYADTLGVASDDVAVDESADGGARRRLLALEQQTHTAWHGKAARTRAAGTPATVSLDVKIALSFSDAENAAERGEDLRAALADPSSDVATTLRYRVSRIIARHTAKQLAENDVSVGNVAVRPIAACKPDPAWVRNISVLGVPGWFSCGARGAAGFAVDVGPHGPQTAQQWHAYDALNEALFDPALGVPRAAYSFAFDAEHVEHHWLWYDFCALRPGGASVDAATWQAMRAMVAERCCACAGAEAEASTVAWPLPAREPVPGRFLPVNPQARDAVWQMGADAHAVRRVPCRAGAFAHGTACEPCVRGTFGTASGCQACAQAGETTAGMYATGAAACVCDAGLFRDSAGACLPCPRDTYKTAVGDDRAMCTPCPAQHVARQGSSTLAQCARPRQILYEDSLGALAYHTKLHLEWTAPAPDAQPHEARCIHVDGSVSCPEREFPSAYQRVGTRAPTWMAARMPEFEYAHAFGGVRGARVYVSEGHRAPGHTAFAQRLNALQPGTVLAHAVRAQLPPTRVFLVSMLARRELREHDWQWILCGARGADGVARYTRCRAGSDPDVAAGRNGENVDVLDLHVRELAVTPETRSCYSFHDGWAAGCATEDTHTYDAAWEWAPSVGAHAGPVWAYTWFLLGESDACRAHGCDESAAMVATLPPVRSHRLVLLPGFEVHVLRPPPPPAAAFVLEHASGLLGGSHALHLAGAVPALPPSAPWLAVSLEPRLKMQVPDTEYDVLAFFTPRGDSSPAPWERMLCTQQQRVRKRARTLHLLRPAGVLNPIAAPADQRFEGFETSTLFGTTHPAVSACDLSVALDQQPLPCAYTKADVLARYHGQRAATREVRGEVFPCYTAPLGAENTTVTAFGQACRGAQTAGSCVCGTLVAAWAVDDTGTYTRRVLRAVPSPAGGVLVTELAAQDVAAAHVLAQSTLRPDAEALYLEFPPDAEPDPGTVAHAACPDVEQRATLMHSMDRAACCADGRRCAAACPGAGAFEPRTGAFTWHVRAPLEPADMHVVVLARAPADAADAVGAFARPSFVSRIGSSVHVRVVVSDAPVLPVPTSLRAYHARRPIAAGVRRQALHKPDTRPRQRLRRLLVAGSSSTDDVAQTSVARETHGIDAHASILEQSCQATTGACAMLQLTLQVSAAEYCLPQADLIAAKGPAMQTALRAISAQPDLVVDIVFIDRPRYIEDCVLAGGSARRLLEQVTMERLNELGITINAINGADSGELTFVFKDPEQYHVKELRLLKQDGNPRVLICPKTEFPCKELLTTIDSNYTDLVQDLRTENSELKGDRETRNWAIAGASILVLVLIVGCLCYYRLNRKAKTVSMESYADDQQTPLCAQPAPHALVHPQFVYAAPPMLQQPERMRPSPAFVPMRLHPGMSFGP